VALPSRSDGAVEGSYNRRMATEDGDDNVFIGQGPFPRGNGNVVIRPGGPCGYIRIGGGVAIGRDAQADGTSVAIGSGAGAGRRSAMSRWRDSPWIVTIVAGTIAAVASGALLALLHI
jgi:hypothetical protein